ncbi:MAG: hypothetical protein GMKNLPBB_02558 [Myxococcota bacterium]|nr:hypothetical protein [Myxococcota bacterium]
MYLKYKNNFRLMLLRYIDVAIYITFLTAAFALPCAAEARPRSGRGAIAITGGYHMIPRGPVRDSLQLKGDQLKSYLLVPPLATARFSWQPLHFVDLGIETGYAHDSLESVKGRKMDSHHILLGLTGTFFLDVDEVVVPFLALGLGNWFTIAYATDTTGSELEGGGQNQYLMLRAGVRFDLSRHVGLFLDDTFYWTAIPKLDGVRVPLSGNSINLGVIFFFGGPAPVEPW